MQIGVRTDVFAAASNPTMSRIIDYLATKDSDESDPLITWIAESLNIYYQVPETEEFHVDPPCEWKLWRKSKGLDAAGVV